MTDVVFVSSNRHKYLEVAEILRPYGVRVRWRPRELLEPQAPDLATVVEEKLDQVRAGPGYVLVEDSGLFVPSLGGFPGVYSAHFLRIWGFDPLLELLRHRDRRAYFETVAGLRRGSRRWTFRGRVHGSIARRPRGAHGFGYDPIFVPAASARTFGEIAPERKNALSHRARAVRQVGRWLQQHARDEGDRRSRRPSSTALR